MTDLLPFLRLYRQHWLSLSIGLLLALVTLVAGMGLLSLSGWFLSAAAVAGLAVATRDTFNYTDPAGACVSSPSCAPPVAGASGS